MTRYSASRGIMYSAPPDASGNRTDADASGNQMDVDDETESPVADELEQPTDEPSPAEAESKVSDATADD